VERRADLNFRDGMYYALTGDTFDGKKAKEIGSSTSPSRRRS
jgi:hypothetical protein